MYRVLVTDSTFEALDIERAILEPLGCVVESRQCKSPAQLLEFVPSADFVITQFAPVNAAVIEAMARARLIVRYGIGVDNVDLDAARSHGIPVCNVPDYCIDEVADHTLAFILATTRQVVPHCLRLRDGRWGLEGPLEGMRTLRELTVGVVGCGRIGRAVIQRLLPFGCRVLVVSIRASSERSGRRARGAGRRLARRLTRRERRGHLALPVHGPDPGDDQCPCPGDAQAGGHPREPEPGRPGRHRRAGGRS